MVNHQTLAPDLDAVFRALADQTRRAMLHRLSQSACTVSELAQPFRMSLAAASKHLKVLEGAGLISRRIEGRQHFCSLAPAGLQGAQQWLDFYQQFWNERFDALDQVIAAESRKTPRKPSHKSPKDKP
jgi:DNA-binding transcriptional ArsR family regulator